jgi:hypothetical protein
MADMPKRKEVERKIVQKALADAGFKQALISDPKATIEKEFGIQIPPNVSVQVHEESVDDVNVVLHVVVPKGEKVSEAELDAVAGGACWSHCSCEG